MTIVNGTIWIAAEYKQDLRIKSNLLQAVAVAEELFEAFREKGVKYIYCTADSPESFKFNELLGFHTANYIIHDKYEVMEKEL